MKKFGRALGMIAAVLLPSCGMLQVARRPEPKMTLPEQLEQKTVAMVHYVAPDEDGDMVPAAEDAPGASLTPYCSGVWITKDTFVTAGHCVEDLGKPFEQVLLEHLVPEANWEAVGIKKWNPIGQTMMYSARGDIKDTETRTIRGTHPGKVIAYDRCRDLALVKATPNSTDAIPDHDVATVASSAKVGQPVHIIGHTIGLWWSYTHGYVAQVRPNMPNFHEDKMNTLQVSAPVFFGNSGGGAFNEDGQLVGIMSWIRKGPDLGFFVRYDEVDHVLRHARITR
jgi:S1-C subfamily serine protease